MEENEMTINFSQILKFDQNEYLNYQLNLDDLLFSSDIPFEDKEYSEKEEIIIDDEIRKLILLRDNNDLFV